MLNKSPSINFASIEKKKKENYSIDCRDQDSNLGYHGHNVGS